MSSTTASPLAGKTPGVATTYHSQGPSSTPGEHSQRRSGSSGAGSQSKYISQPRNINQASKRHRTTPKRARLVDDEATEVAAMRAINSRKGQTSITHLMNFSLPPRPQPQQQHHQHAHQYARRNPTWGLGSGYHAVDKARYVHANYRFIVRPTDDYRVHASDADVYLKWDQVLQVLASADTQSTHCPICLSTPVAPRIAKCGHISCLPCLIRYMHASDDANPVPEKRPRWKKCPICEDSIYVSEVRPVRWFSGQEASLLREGGDVLLKLVQRLPGATLALPRDAAEAYGPTADIPWFNVAEVMDYARIMKGGGHYMDQQYDQEIVDLRQQEKEDELMFGDENTWTQKAVASIEEARQKIQDLDNPPLPRFGNAAMTQTAAREDDLPDSWETAADAETEGGKNEHGEFHHAMQDLSLRPTPAGHRQHPFYFYHALPNFFLSPLDIRILKTAFGDFAAFPSTILPRVEHISTGHVVDDDLRKRAKYMAHLPHGCEVSFLECDWTDIIHPHTLDQFRDEIAKRRQRNFEKEAKEERDRLRAEKREDDQKWAAIRSRRPDSISKSFSETDFLPLVPPTASSPEDNSATTPPWGMHRTQSSFATLGSPGTSPEGLRTVWGTAAVTPASPVIHETVVERPQVGDGWLQDWEKDLLDEHDAVNMVEAHIGGDLSKPAVAVGGKKGRKKKITLMSTNHRRGA